MYFLFFGMFCEKVFAHTVVQTKKSLYNHINVKMHEMCVIYIECCRKCNTQTNFLRYVFKFSV